MIHVLPIRVRVTFSPPQSFMCLSFTCYGRACSMHPIFSLATFDLFIHPTNRYMPGIYDMAKSTVIINITTRTEVQEKTFWHTPINQACVTGDLNTLKRLTHGRRRITWVLPIHFACLFGNLEVLKYIGSRVKNKTASVKNRLFATAMGSACRGGHVPLVCWLKTNHIGVLKHDLLSAARFDKSQVVEWYMDEHKTHLNVPIVLQLFDICCEQKQEVMMRMIFTKLKYACEELSFQPRWSTECEELYLYACWAGYTEMIKWVEERGWATAKKGLQGAALGGNFEIVDRFLPKCPEADRQLWRKFFSIGKVEMIEKLVPVCPAYDTPNKLCVELLTALAYGRMTSERRAYLLAWVHRLRPECLSETAYDDYMHLCRRQIFECLPQIDETPEVIRMFLDLFLPVSPLLCLIRALAKKRDYLVRALVERGNFQNLNSVCTRDVPGLVDCGVPESCFTSRPKLKCLRQTHKRQRTKRKLLCRILPVIPTNIVIHVVGQYMTLA
jgi:hypothetical protein